MCQITYTRQITCTLILHSLLQFYPKRWGAHLVVFWPQTKSFFFFFFCRLIVQHVYYLAERQDTPKCTPSPNLYEVTLKRRRCKQDSFIYLHVVEFVNEKEDSSDIFQLI